MKQPHTQADALLSRCRRLLHDHRTRARQDGQVLEYNLDQLRELLAASPCCAYCRMPVSWSASIDHKTPIARGGRNAFSNLAVCCRRCNALKGQFTEAEFLELLTMLALLHPAARSDLERRLLAGSSRYAAGARSRSKTARNAPRRADAS
jgi:hypothetical protein